MIAPGTLASGPLFDAISDHRQDQVFLPRRTGHCPTGTTLVHLVDKDRTDPFPPAWGQRELMTQF